MFTIHYMTCGRKWRVVAHEGGGVVNKGLYCIGSLKTSAHSLRTSHKAIYIG